jgi:aminopeptidase N
MKSRCTTFLFVAFALTTYAQFPENTYQSTNNKHYWKNRKPNEGYWQQDVYYKINAALNDSTNIITGAEELTYTNNSPDELNVVYFHLYSNAQAKGAYLADLYKNNGKKLKYGKYEEQGLGCNVSNISVNDVELKTEQDNTILKVYLKTPLKSGENVTFKINFKTYFDNGTIRNRMKLFNAYGFKHYDVVHWYPRISVYDKKQGWDTDQHMDHEFYGDYGTYDVAFTLPNNYIADATGTLVNMEEAMPDELRQKLDISNFATKQWEEKPSVIIVRDNTTKTWKYHAENVHDFALTTDPTYRIGEAEWNGIKCVALVQEPHAAHWQNAAAYAAKVIKINSEDFGMYEYPKIIVADARDGMEYPMLTLDGGYDPDYRDLLVHEISHNWFFGMVGSNETYRAALDEGFTQFLTAWTYEKIDGKERIESPIETYRVRKDGKKIITNPITSYYVNQYNEPDYIINSEVYDGYMNAASKGKETTINLHSDAYNGALGHGGGYSQVYFKTAVMLYNLQYTLGDSLFLQAMRHYVSQWKFAHPYFEDFRNSIIQFTKVDLNWFFDEWIESTKTVDYAVKSVKRGNNKNEYEITFERKGMQMPIDFSVINDDDSILNFHIPNNWFEKKTTATILPRWIGWDKVKPTYTATVTIPGGIQDVVIDPSNRLADVYMLDNSKKTPVQFRFDSKIYNPSNWKEYELFARPDVWYNGYDGLKMGAHVNGNYLNYKHIVDATFWLNMGLGQNYLDPATEKLKHDKVSFIASYTTSTDKFMKGSSVYASAKALDGLHAYIAGFDRKSSSEKTRVYMYFKSMYRGTLNDLVYLMLPTEWLPNQLNNTINLGLEHKYNYEKGNGSINLGVRSSAIKSDYDYQSVQLNAINSTRLWKFLLKTRLFGQYGTGKYWANESSLFLAGANPEDMMDNKYTRSQGFFNPAWATIGASTNYFQYGGGLNLRGYAGYLAPQNLNDGSIVYTYKGQTGAALNTELEFSDLVKIKRRNWFTNTLKLTTYLFADAGVINYTTPSITTVEFADIRMDAGLGSALTIKRFGILQKVKPLTIRFDMPFFLSSVPAMDNNYVQYRFVIGINRAF